MQRTKGKDGKGEPKTSWETSIPRRISEKNRDPPSPFSLETVQSSLSDSPKKQENKCFLSFVVPSCRITSFTSKHVTAQKNRMLYCSVAQVRAEAGRSLCNQGGK